MVGWPRWIIDLWLSLSALAAVVPAALGRQEPASGVRQSDALYPAARAESVVRFFTVDTDEADLAKVREALRELGAEVAYGPRTTAARPGHSFFALRAPEAAAPRKLAAALKKGGAAAHELVCVAFDGREERDANVGIAGFSFTTRDFILGMSGDIAWFDSVGSWSQFYGPPGKLKSSEIADRYEKLYAPYGGGRVGSVVRERFTWTLAAAPDEKAEDRLLKAIHKLEGVARAALEGPALVVEVELDGLLASGVAGKIPAAEGQVLDEAGRDAPRAAFATQPLYDLLAAEKLLPRTPVAEPGAGD